MGIVQDLLKDVPLPRMVRAKQLFAAQEPVDVESTLRQELAKPEISNAIRPGMRVAVAVGSRGLTALPTLVRITVDELKARGAFPFIVPAMGSHGGANAKGQVEVLQKLGITESTSGCAIVSSMEVAEIGRLANGLPVYMDKNAYAADGIVIIARAKAHTGFRGKHESGLVKMIAIGLGKQKGADSCHSLGYKYMAENLAGMAEVALARGHFLFAVGTVENAYDKIARIVAVKPAAICDTDQELLIEAKANMPRILFDHFDVLIVNEIGKAISGGGMDTNVVGRYSTPYASGGPSIERIALLDLTDDSQGNAIGMGLADIATRRIFNKLDFDKMYANGITATVPISTRVPMIMECDRDAVRVAIKTCHARDLSKVRLVRIQDTLHLSEIEISEAMIEDARLTPGMVITSEPKLMQFDENGDFIERSKWVATADLRGN
jgi:hypothetical protein